MRPDIFGRISPASAQIAFDEFAEEQSANFLIRL